MLTIKHAIKYALSWRWRGINNSIADLILEMENNRYIQTQVSLVDERYLQHSPNGWVSGYKLRTKRYDSKDKARDSCADLMNAESTNEIFKTNDTNEDSTDGKGNTDIYKNKKDKFILDGGDHNMCTICLLDIEDGDIIADVKCGHVYHANCLKEWILKKVRPVITLLL